MKSSTKSSKLAFGFLILLAATLTLPLYAQDSQGPALSPTAPSANQDAPASPDVSSHGLSAGSPEVTSADDSEMEMLTNARLEQNDFFRQLQEDMLNGTPIDAAAGACTYISAIFKAPPPKTVVLTFDDGPSSELTPQVLNILKKYGIKATFFNQGNNAHANPKIVARVKAEGHMIGSHSYDHPNFHEISQQDQINQVTTTDGILRKVLGRPKLFRYPYGNSTCSTNVLLKKMGYDGIVGWHIDSCDWAFSKTGSVDAKRAQACEVAPQNMSNFVGHVLSEVRRHNGGIILMHETHVRTVANLESIIVRLKAEGFQFANLNEPRMAVYFR